MCFSQKKEDLKIQTNNKVYKPFVVYLWILPSGLIHGTWDSPLYISKGDNFFKKCLLLPEDRFYLTNSVDTDEMQHYRSSLLAKVLV